MNCPKCRQPNSPGSQFCISCGSPLVVPAPSTPTPLSTPAATISASAIYAGFWKRLAAFLLDGIILSITWIIGGFIVVLAAGKFSDDIGTLLDVIRIILGWLYFSLMESSSNQATVGKMALGIKVTDVNGNRISFARATGRYFAKIISGLILLIGYIMAAFTEKKQALHDMIAGTLVVKK